MCNDDIEKSVSSKNWTQKEKKFIQTLWKECWTSEAMEEDNFWAFYYGRKIKHKGTKWKSKTPFLQRKISYFMVRTLLIFFLSPPRCELVPLQHSLSGILRSSFWNVFGSTYGKKSWESLVVHVNFSSWHCVIPHLQGPRVSSAVAWFNL
jgi:hypothetical protein